MTLKLMHTLLHICVNLSRAGQDHTCTCVVLMLQVCAALAAGGIYTCSDMIGLQLLCLLPIVSSRYNNLIYAIVPRSLWAASC